MAPKNEHIQRSSDETYAQSTGQGPSVLCFEVLWLPSKPQLPRELQWRVRAGISPASP